MIANLYSKAKFLKSAAKISQLPEDTGYEVAFAGRSNAGKSSALNTLTGIRQLARTSKTPGRTQLINLFELDEERRLVDLPGYGYAKVNLQMKKDWQTQLSLYLETRESLKGLILLMDVRHPLKDTDQNMIEWAVAGNLPLHLLLTKSDKISRSEGKNTLIKVLKHYSHVESPLSAQLFSSLKTQGLDELISKLNEWYKVV